METLTAYFMSAGFTKQEASQIAGRFLFKKLNKGELFVEEGKTSRHLGFIESGYLQYFLYADGEEKTTYSIGENNFVASLVSFLKQVPSRENVRAIVDTTLWLIDREVLIELQRTIPAFNSFYIGMLEWQVCCIEESRVDAIMLSAQDRYNKMMLKEPALILQLPLKYLASIMGVTPRHLSRLRNNIN
jgi:CRP-like cAMP-binding protein